MVIGRNQNIDRWVCSQRETQKYCRMFFFKHRNIKKILKFYNFYSTANSKILLLFPLNPQPNEDIPHVFHLPKYLDFERHLTLSNFKGCYRYTGIFKENLIFKNRKRESLFFSDLLQNRTPKHQLILLPLQWVIVFF